MTLSIIVPVYNMASDNKLNYCIDSILNQTFTDFELILIDDCSTDNSYEILSDYKSKYPDKIILLKTPINSKQGGAKNLGLEYVTGDWISFIDSDDWISPVFYEKLLDRARATGADMVGCDYNITNTQSLEVGKIIPNNSIEQSGKLDIEKYRLLVLSSGSLVVKIYKRDIILGVQDRFPSGIFYEDNAISRLWMLRATHFEYINEPLYYYYQHDNSTVHTVSLERCNHRIIASKIMVDLLKKHNFYDNYAPEIEMTFASPYYTNTLFSIMQGTKKNHYRFLKELAQCMKDYFPDFQSNKYFIASVNSEERKLVKLHMKSTLLFIIYYRALWAYRDFRKFIARKK